MWRSFVKPLLITLLMHGLGIALLIFGLPDAQDKLLVRPMPKFVNAELVVLEKPKPKPAPKPKPQPKPEPKPAPKPEPKPEPKKPEPKPEPKPAPKPKVDEAKKKAEREKAERERQEALKAQQRRELESALSEDEELLQAHEDEQIAAHIGAKIKRAASLAWSRPPSARNGMVAEVRVRMLKSGQLIDPQLTKSSGDAAFDRSVIQAVQRMGDFPEVSQIEYRIFKEELEFITITFRPEDLKR